MAILTLANSSMARPMVRESTLGKMERFMMASGTRVSSKDMASGRELGVILTSASGVPLRLMVTESIHGQTETGMRGSGTCA